MTGDSEILSAKEIHQGDIMCIRSTIWIVSHIIHHQIHHAGEMGQSHAEVEGQLWLDVGCGSNAH